MTHWTPPDIKAALAKKGWTLAAIDRDAGYYTGAARQALRGNCYKAAARISEILDVPMHELFPGMYIVSKAGRPEPHRQGGSSHKATREASQNGATRPDSARVA